MDPARFNEYLLARNAMSPQRQIFYNMPHHTNLRFKAYINTQRSESRLMKNLKTAYGEDIVIVMGDWSDAGHTPKYQIPTKTKGWRKTFARHKVSIMVSLFK